MGEKEPNKDCNCCNFNAWIAARPMCSGPTVQVAQSRFDERKVGTCDSVVGVFGARDIRGIMSPPLGESRTHSSRCASPS